MAAKIFVNYRRDDTLAAAGRLHDRLAQAFGRRNIFMDVDHIPAGVDFVGWLENQVASCDVFLTVIGPGWIEARDAEGRRRIDVSGDFVAVEIAAALARDIRVIPVLIDGAPMPRADELPEPLKPLARRNAVEVRNSQFGRDADLLVTKIRDALKSSATTAMPSVPWAWVGATAASVLAIAYVGAYQLGVPVWAPWSQSPSPLQPTREQLEAAARQSVLREQKAADDARAQKAAADAAEAKRRSDEAERQRAAAAEAKRLSDAATAKKAQDDEAERQRVAAELRERQAAEQRQREAAAKKAEDDRKRADAAAAMHPGRVFRDCNDGCPEMVVLPAGTFMMGEGSSQRRTSIAQPFAVGKFEVTFAEWEACVAGGSCTSNKNPSDRGWGKGRRPVINVSWNDAKEYVAWLSRKTGQTYRLLTEAEWEYAARAGTTTAYWWGDKFDGSKANNNGSQTVPVGQFAANAFGLHDMHGNVWEWCEDAYDSPSCVVRGGSWLDNPDGLRSSNRLWYAPDYRDSYIGFRVARVLSPARTL